MRLDVDNRPPPAVEVRGGIPFQCRRTDRDAGARDALESLQVRTQQGALGALDLVCRHELFAERLDLPLNSAQHYPGGVRSDTCFHHEWAGLMPGHELAADVIGQAATLA